MDSELPRKSGQKPSRSKAWLAWPIRAILLVGTFILCWQVIYPAFAFPVGLGLGGLVAAAAIGLEILFTGLLTERTFARVIGFRLFIIDHLLSDSEETLFVSREQWDKQQDTPTLLESGPVAEDIDPFHDEYVTVLVEEEEIIDAEVVEDEATR